MAQYPAPAPAGGVTPQTLGSPEAPETRGETDQQDLAGDNREVQSGQQVEAAGEAGGLPFTGLALIAMLLAGTALLGAGLALRGGARATAS